MYRLASLIVAGAVVAAGFAVYAEPPADPGDDPPVLLKKKGRPRSKTPRRRRPTIRTRTKTRTRSRPTRRSRTPATASRTSRNRTPTRC